MTTHVNKMERDRKNRMAERVEDWVPPMAVITAESAIILMCDWEERIEKEENRDGISLSGLISISSLVNSYTFEIMLKTLSWLDNYPRGFRKTHDVLVLYDELKEHTKSKLNDIGINREMLIKDRKPFESGRYWMQPQKNRKGDLKMTGPVSYYQIDDLNEIINLVNIKIMDIVITCPHLEKKWVDSVPSPTGD